MQLPKIPFFLLVFVSFVGCQAQKPREALSSGNGLVADWLVSSSPFKAKIHVTEETGIVSLSNGLVERRFTTRPNAATVEYRNLVTGEAVLRAVRPEARLVINGTTYEVGGLTGQPEQGYFLEEWRNTMTSNPDAFELGSYDFGRIKERFPWKRSRWSEDRPWPPPGVSLRLNFIPPDGLFEGLEVGVIYEMYDGIPLLSKKIEIVYSGSMSIILDSFTSEILAVVEAESAVNTPPVWELPGIHMESDYAFLADTPKSAAKTTFWLEDPLYTSQVNYRLRTPSVVESRPPVGPSQVIPPGGRFESFMTWELLYDSSDRERRGLALRRMYRTIAPWITENPISMHLRSTDPETVRTAVDQCAETGFEMIILSFGSGLDMENEDPSYLAGLRDLADYAHRSGVEIGGYSLLASRRIDDVSDVIDTVTGKPGGAVFGHSPCLESQWGWEYFRKITNFFETTGFDLLEHDGSYPGDLCASTSHPGHRGLEDSQWTQRARITEFYRWCRARGISLNVPDWYFLSGSNKCAMGYREVNWSLPRERQVLLARQNIYDGTWQKTPTMGWMFVPLVQYHGGGPAATIEPLSEHLDFYEAHLAQNFLSGVQACYRGTRLYDTEETKNAVRKWVGLYKDHRAILDSDIIHLRRPDGRALDGILHVNPGLREKGFAVVYNPTEEDISCDWPLPLYYTGLSDTARISEQGGQSVVYSLDRSYRVKVPIHLPPGSLTWLIIQ